MSNKKTLKVLSPYDQNLIEELPLMGENEVEKALKTAYGLFLDRSSWIPSHKKNRNLGKNQEPDAGKD
ncbi:hypothetical protein A33Q_3290 [Indibacter alkaliphilus LW1]|uniref:Uncharacterized protein n=1 Tax=Indibacter alkaliphilus (strain CCUG 57479 / KCTC 22604 / LW1) TaxID=1189612 RepID=S2DED5_INDAL|nr:hypothetical protein [Indibacter alkaliphilus]EOZ95370.1 hypothetical protein A33Q_3290 [Indibacter alkaliphilus LW1]